MSETQSTMMLPDTDSLMTVTLAYLQYGVQIMPMIY